MISNNEDLRSRGMINQEDIELWKNKEDETLYGLINSKVSTERTVAVHILSARYPKNEEFVKCILERLSKEKCLYTKIEICSALEKGNEETVRLMINYLGRIGENQHKCLPEKASGKKSYPLPRDIIARSLGRMSPAIFPILLEVLEAKEENKLSEVIDAIGYMVFYHTELATEQNCKQILDFMTLYHNHQLILWKILTCLSAFPQEESITTLQGIKQLYPNTIMSEEADRSLKLQRRYS